MNMHIVLFKNFCAFRIYSYISPECIKKDISAVAASMLSIMGNNLYLMIAVFICVYYDNRSNVAFTNANGSNNDC